MEKLNRERLGCFNISYKRRKSLEKSFQILLKFFCLLIDYRLHIFLLMFLVFDKTQPHTLLPLHLLFLTTEYLYENSHSILWHFYHSTVPALHQYALSPVRSILKYPTPCVVNTSSAHAENTCF